MQDERKNGPSKQPALFRLAWVWLGVFGVATLICYFVGWRELSHVLLAVTIVMGTIAEISSRYILVPRLKSRSISNAEPEEDTEAEEFYIHFPDPAESGWHNYTVTPSKNIYKEEFCVGGPPTDISTFEYSVEANQVFARLVDLHEEGLNGVQYEVVSGQVLEAQIRSRKTYDTTDEHIERLRNL
jgi:hypothetical protein